MIDHKQKGNMLWLVGAFFFLHSFFNMNLLQEDQTTSYIDAHEEKTNQLPRPFFVIDDSFLFHSAESEHISATDFHPHHRRAMLRHEYLLFTLQAASIVKSCIYPYSHALFS